MRFHSWGQRLLTLDMILIQEKNLNNDKQVVAVKPQPELARFFLLDYQQRAGLPPVCCTGGPDGIHMRYKQNAWRPLLAACVSGNIGNCGSLGKVLDTVNP